MKRYYPFVFFILILIGCKSEFTSFNEVVLSMAKNDQRIDEREFKELLVLISSSREKGFEQFKNNKGQIENTKVVSYLVKYLNAKKVGLTFRDIWQQESKQETFNINVYLENSGSMNGYMNDINTEFKNSVYSLLTRLKLLVVKDSFNLYLINNDNQLLFGNASNNDLESFKNILNPASFAKLSKGKTGETDINELIKKCIIGADSKNLSVFISDCVYSPGKNKQNAALYLADQKQGIFLNFATEISNRSSDLSVIVLQIEAKFKGIYFDKSNTALYIPNEIKRPFYIWFIGTRKQIESILRSKKLEEIVGGYKNIVVFQKAESSAVRFKIMKSTPRIGECNLEEAATVIKDACVSKEGKSKGLFGFNVAVDFSSSSIGESYFTDVNNYVLSNKKYQLKVEKITDYEKNNATLLGYTHILKLQTSELSEEVLQIDVIGKTPNWVLSSSSIDDSNILNDSSEHNKTFGFRYLIEGVNDAFYPKSESNTLNSISIKIAK